MNITLGPGTLYIEGSPHGTIGEIEEAPDLEPAENGTKENPFIRLKDAFAELTLSYCEMSDAWARFRNSVFDNCPNKRVAHLARHAKKQRVRKKNVYRALEF